MIGRLLQMLHVSIEHVLTTADTMHFLQKPRATLCPWCCEDGTGTLASAAQINSDECVQYYDFAADPGGILESEGLRRGSGKGRAGESWESPRLKRAAQASEPTAKR